MGRHTKGKAKAVYEEALSEFIMSDQIQPGGTDVLENLVRL